MPLGEIDPNAEHPFSRPPEHSVEYVGKAVKTAANDTLASGIAVTSMLKTSTETGDLGPLTIHNYRRLPKLPSSQFKRNNSHTPVRAPSSHYSRTTSLRSKTSNVSTRSGLDPTPSSWLNPSSAYVNQENAQHVYSSLAAQESVRSLAYDIRERLEQSERSMSLTHSIASYPERRLSNHRSMTSLRSAAHALRPHSPIVRHGKLCRPRDYRPSSPALSDPASAQTRHIHRPQPGPRSYTAFSPSMQPRLSQFNSSSSGLPPRCPQPSYSLYPGHMRSASSIRPDRGAVPSTRLFPDGDPRISNVSCVNVANDLSQKSSTTDSNKHKVSTDPTSNKSTSSIFPRQVARFETLRTPSLDATTRGSPSPVRVAFKEVPRKGFVERVRNALEEQISHDEPVNSSPQSHKATHTPKSCTSELQNSAIMPYLDRKLIHDAVAVSPKSPGLTHSSSETMASDKASETTVRRLTRELIKAGTHAAKIDNMIPETSFNSSDDPETSLSDSTGSASETNGLQANSPHSGVADATAFQSDPSDTSCNGELSMRAKSSADLERSNSVSVSENLQRSSTLNLSTLKNKARPQGPANPVRLSDDDETGDHVMEPLPHLGGSESLPKQPLSETSGADDKIHIAELSNATNCHETMQLGSSNVERATFLSNESITADEVNIMSKDYQESSKEGMFPDHWKSSLQHRHVSQHNPSDNNMSNVQSESKSKTQGKDIYAFDSQICSQAEDSAQSLVSSALDPFPMKQRRSTNMAGQTPSLESEGKESAEEAVTGDVGSSCGFPTATFPIPSSSHGIPMKSISKRAYGFEHRYSISNNPNTSRFGLADLTEDSQEDYSVTNLRILGARPPVFGNIADSTNKRDSRALKKVALSQKQASTYLAQGFQNTLELPTLNFSRYDLTSKLNQALGIRSSRSFESLKNRRSRSSTVPIAVSEQLEPADFLRERYRSFFEFLEDQQDTGQDRRQSEKIDVQNATSPQATAIADSELLEEISRLSIPSVQTLSIRISALFPTVLKTSQSEADLGVHEGAVNRMVEQIQGLGTSERLASMDLTKDPSLPNSESSLLFRNSTANKGNSLVVEDTDIRGGSMLDLMKELPPLPNPHTSDPVTSQCSRIYATEAKTTSQNNPCPALVPKSLDGPEADNMHELEAKELKRIKTFSGQQQKVQEARQRTVLRHASKLSPSGFSSHDKNDDFSFARPTLPVNMPVSSSDVDETSLPAISRSMNPSAPESPLDLCSNASVKIARSMSPGFDSALVPVADPFADNDDKEYKRGKKNALGSLARRIGVKSNIDQAGFPIDPYFLHPEERTMDPGDRYPTTSLTTPSALTLDGRSYFSDDSSMHKENKSFRKRITRLNFRRSASRPASLQDENDNKEPTILHTSSHTTPWETVTQGESAFTDPSSAGRHDEAEPNIILMYERPAAGMSKTEFRAKRLLEKLRVLWTRGGRVFRTKHRKEGPLSGQLQSSDTYVVK